MTVGAEDLAALYDLLARNGVAVAEVRVENSKDRVALLLHGVDGPLRWRDLEIRGAVHPDGAKPDDPVEFNVPYRRN